MKFMRRASVAVLAAILPSLSWASSGDDLVAHVRAAVAYRNLAMAENEVAAYRARAGSTPAVLEAVSWIGRGALAAGNLDKAETCASETRRLALGLVRHGSLDSDRHLPLALGNSIEVQAQIMVQTGRRAEAVQFLTEERERWRRTSIRARIQKNLLLLTFEGRPAPKLEAAEWMGPKPPPLESLRGHPVLLFFWAHWCSDCKQQAPEIARLLAEYRNSGLVAIGPTQRYGYIGGGEEAGPDVERRYIDLVRQRFYAVLPDMPVPVSEENFKVYGASTTPTLVLIDAKGAVRMYHPGAMPYAELNAALRRLLAR